MACSVKVTQYEELQCIGTGAFARCYLSRRIEDGRLFVVKKINRPLDELDFRERQDVLKEIDVLSHLNHPNIVLYITSFIHPDTHLQHIVMEFASGGTLNRLIKNAGREHCYFPERKVCELLAQIVASIAYIHSQGILHRDLKTQNILLWGESKRVVKLADFGISTVISSNKLANTFAGTPYYLSPEIWAGKSYDFESDVWALGCVLHEMMALCKPFDADSMPGVMLAVTRGDRQPIPADAVYSAELVDLLDRMLVLDPGHRLTVSQIQEHPVVKRALLRWETERDDLMQEESHREDAEAAAYIGGTTDDSESQLILAPLQSPRTPAVSAELSMSALSRYDMRRQVSQLIKNNRCFKWGHGQSKPMLEEKLLMYSPTHIASAEEHGAGDHTLCATNTSLLLVWGCSDDGRLGLGPSARDSRFPTAVDFFLQRAVVVKQVACGDRFSAALDDHGEVWIWGDLEGDCDDDVPPATALRLLQEPRNVPSCSKRQDGSCAASPEQVQQSTEFDMDHSVSSVEGQTAERNAESNSPTVTGGREANVARQNTRTSWPAWARKRSDEIQRNGTECGTNGESGTNLNPCASPRDMLGGGRVGSSSRMTARSDTGESNPFASEIDEESSESDSSSEEGSTTGKATIAPSLPTKSGSRQPLLPPTLNIQMSSGSSGSAEWPKWASERSKMLDEQERADGFVSPSNQVETLSGKDSACEPISPAHANPFASPRRAAGDCADLDGDDSSSDSDESENEHLSTNPPILLLGESPPTPPQKPIDHHSTKDATLRPSTPHRAAEIMVINADDDASKLSIGCRVDLQRKGKGWESDCGTLRFMGLTEFAAGEWLGVELDEPTGKNDGVVKGKRYFKANASHGSFVRRKACRRHGVSSTDQPASASSDAATVATAASAVALPSKADEHVACDDVDQARSFQRYGKQRSGSSFSTIRSPCADAAHVAKAKIAERIDDLDHSTNGIACSDDRDDNIQTIFYEPRLVGAFLYGVAVQVACGGRFVAVLAKSGRVYTWGENDYGQLGIGDDKTRSVPTRVKGKLEKLFVAELSAGNEFMMVLTGKEGRVFAWGNGEHGQLGYGEDVYDEPQCLPRPVGGDLTARKVRQIVCGMEHSAAVTEEGEVFTWGRGDSGQLGHDDTQPRNEPTVVEELSRSGDDAKVRLVACGAAHTVALTEDRVMYSWGLGEGGRLGLGPRHIREPEVAPRVVTAIKNHPISSIFAGYDCTFALTQT